MESVRADLMASWSNAKVFVWRGLSAARPVGDLVCEPELSLKTVMIIGVLDGGTLLIEGSLMLADPIFKTLRNEFGSNLSFLGTDQYEVVREPCCTIRPRLTEAAADRTDRVDVYLHCTRR